MAEYPKWLTLAADVGPVLVASSEEEQAMLQWWADNRAQAGAEQAEIAAAAQALADAEAASIAAEQAAAAATDAVDDASDALASKSTRKRGI